MRRRRRKKRVGGREGKERRKEIQKGIDFAH
jgi:hypothetical protein